MVEFNSMSDVLARNKYSIHFHPRAAFSHGRLYPVIINTFKRFNRNTYARIALMHVEHIARVGLYRAVVLHHPAPSRSSVCDLNDNVTHYYKSTVPYLQS